MKEMFWVSLYSLVCAALSQISENLRESTIALYVMYGTRMVDHA